MLWAVLKKGLAQFKQEDKLVCKNEQLRERVEAAMTCVCLHVTFFGFTRFWLARHTCYGGILVCHKISMILFVSAYSFRYVDIQVYLSNYVTVGIGPFGSL